MNYFNKICKGIGLLALTLVLFTGCKDYNDLNLEPVESGEADFSTYVAVGNSLTAGFQNNALYASAQEFSYPNLIARQIRQEENFSQPLISDPGLSPSGRIELASLDPIVTVRTPVSGTPINQGEKPFNNLGIPGAVLVDYLNPNNSGDLKARATNPQHPAYNPFYGIVLEQSVLEQAAPNIHSQVVKQNPTLITFWLGHNDVLGFVTSGGEGQPITPVADFTQLYQLSGQALASTGATVVVYNLFNVTNLPFVFYLRAELERAGAIVLNQEGNYQLVTPNGNLNIYIETDSGPRVMGAYDFPLLSASSYFAQVQAGEVAPPVQPAAAIPDNLVLDGTPGDGVPDSELEQAAGAVAAYNTVIENVASSNGFVLVDANGFFTDVFATFQSSGGQTGLQVNGLNLRPVPGELFSFDGVHPSNRGSAVIANTTIKAMNESLGSDIPLINVAKIPEGYPVVSNAVAIE